MNENTKNALVTFAASVGQLAGGTMHLIGVDLAKEIVDSCEKLVDALEKDETIP